MPTITWGDMPTLFGLPTDWEWHYRGLDFGGDTDYNVVKVSGLLGLPDVQSTSVKRAGAHGFEPGRQLAGKRSGTIDIEYGGGQTTDPELARARDDLLRAFQPLDVEAPLIFGVPGHAARQLACRVTAVDAPLEISWLLGGVATFSVQVEAESDPMWRSGEMHSGVTMPQQPSIGRPYPRFYDWAYGELSQVGPVIVTNDGNAGASWSADIQGPCIDPQIIFHHPAGVARIKLAVSLNSNQFIRLNSRRETILVMGSQPRFDTLLPGSEWFEIPPGSSQVFFQSNDAQGACTFNWRDAWW